MKKLHTFRLNPDQSRIVCTMQARGFALISTILVMSLLLVIAIAMLSHSSIATRTVNSSKAQIQAQANAKLALMIALGELQTEMGSDMRISAESALFDTDKDTEEIEGVQQSHWTASYNAWGNWLNAEYSFIQPNGSSSPIEIGDTYVDKRAPMFRRWLLSLPEDQVSNIDAPITGAGLDDNNSVILVGEGSLGHVDAGKEHLHTKAYLQKIAQGNIAWWIGSENHKTTINLPKSNKNLTISEVESSQGNTSEVAISSIEGFESIKDNTDISNKLISQQSLRPASISKEHIGKNFFNLTAHSQGLLTSVRTGALKKDLSLLLEADKLPAPYDFKIGDAREPSIRPMSSDLIAKNPRIPGRHFASWTRLRHYYRMYRQTSDATKRGTMTDANLQWDNYKPWTPVVSPLFNELNSSDTYIRLPIMAKLTFIYSLQSIPVPNTNPKRYNCYLVYTPVYTFWNPYNVELRLGSRDLGTLSLPYKILPLGFYSYKNGSQIGGIQSVYQDLKQDYGSYFATENNSEIVFQPGELKLFSYRSSGNDTGKQTSFLPGFDPQAIGGDKLLIHSEILRTENPGIALTFANPAGEGGNVWFGNTPGSLNNPFFWKQSGNAHWLPTMYAHDWFQKDQVNTPITPEGSAEIGKWQFADDEPLPFAFNQFVIKTSSEFEYESIGWNQDWRCKNWLQAPPYYFGSAQFISTDSKIANTQRMDNPYVMHFGPMSGAEMPKVVPHFNERAFLGSGSAPHEKVTSAVMLELPTSPLSSIAAFSNMRMNPGWVNDSALKVGGNANSGPWNSLSGSNQKGMNYQSGITGGGIGNSFLHPMLPRDDVYRFFDNSKSSDVSSWANNTTERDNKIYSDYWDHTLLLNDAIWDDYYTSSLADQTRSGAPTSLSLDANIDHLLDAGNTSANSRLKLISSNQSRDHIKAELLATDGYLKSAKHLIVEGMFNVNSTSVDAWLALFTGIRSREIVERESGELEKVKLSTDKTIALSRFNTEVSGKEMDDPENGVRLSNGTFAWTGIRYLNDGQLKKLASECVKQVKLRGPFLNFSEFINRRLSNDELGLMGALQSAIDYDDSSPDSASINFRYKNGPDYMITEDQLGEQDYRTPEAALGSRFTAIPGYVIQSDLLKPISNTLAVRDDTFRIRAYGETLDTSGTVIARAWCEAIVQRQPAYCDPSNNAAIPARILNKDGEFEDNPDFTEINRKFGRKFQILSFKWLSKDEI